MIGRSWRYLVVCVCIAGAMTLGAPAALGAPLVPTALPAPLGAESEPDDAPAQASPLLGDMRVRASLQPAGDVDYYRFEAHAGERVFAGVITAGQLAAPADSRLTLLAGDGVTPLESDDNNGSQLELASSIAGTMLPGDGAYYLRVEDARGAAAIPAPYDLYLALRGGAVTPEEEPNNTLGEADPLVNGEVTGTHEPGADPAKEPDKDWFAVNLQAGDTVFLALDLDPERDGRSFDGTLGFGPAGDDDKTEKVLTVDDPQPGDPPEASPPSEAMTMTVSKGGTYFAYVDVETEKGKVDTGGPWATYDLAVTVFPRSRPGCRTYGAAGGILPDGGAATFPIQVEDAARVARAAVRLDLQESVMADLDVSLRSPAGLEQPLFTDVGATEPGGQQHLEAVFDDYAATPPLYRPLRPLGLQPDLPLAGFTGQQAQGTWALTVSDDTANASVGGLAAAELVICPEAEAPPAASPRPVASATPPPARPQLTDLKIAPPRFRAAKAGGTVLAKRPPAGGAIASYLVTAAARTELTIARARPGRKVGGKCVAETRANVSRKRCNRYVKVTDFSRDDGAGRNRFVLSGRVGGQPLPPGAYRLQADASAGPALTSAAASASFTILPPAPR